MEWSPGHAGGLGLWLGWFALRCRRDAPDAAEKHGAAAQALVGKALFLRGFYLTNDLNYDAEGRVLGSPKVGDWTLAAVNVLKVERPGSGEIELDGVRVAIRYNADVHEFQRHPLNDEKMRLIVKDSGDARQLEAAFAAMFAIGIDPGLQRATGLLGHYFDPALAWPQDALSRQTVYTLYGAADRARRMPTAPRAEHPAGCQCLSFLQCATRCRGLCSFGWWWMRTEFRLGLRCPGHRWGKVGCECGGGDEGNGPRFAPGDEGWDCRWRPE